MKVVCFRFLFPFRLLKKQIYLLFFILQMSQQQQQDELAATQTEGYRLGEKKDISEFKKLDANDESLNKWKASLGLADGDSAVGKFVKLF